MNVHKILENFEVMDLPSLPQVLVELVEACYRVDATFEQLAGWIEMDPGLCAKALTFIGARGADAPPRLTSFQTLLKKLGHHTLRALAVSSAARGNLVAGAAPPVSIAFWRRSVRCAVNARNLATATGYRSPDEAYLAGLLHNVGQLVLETTHPDQYAALRRKARRDTQLLLLEREQFGAGHNDIGAQLIESWGLNSFIADAARFHHQPLGYLLDAHPLVRIAFLANLLSNTGARPLDAAFDAAEQLFGLGRGPLADLITRTGETVAELSRTLDLPTDRAREDEAAEPSPSTTPLGRKVSEIALLDGIRPRLNRAGDRDALLVALERGASLILGERPTLFFFHDPPSGTLTGAKPGREDDLVSELTIRMAAGNSVICRALDDNRPTHSFEEEAPPLTVVDRQIIGRLGTAGMLCLPLSGGETRLGTLVVGIDRRHLPRIEVQGELLAAFAAEATHQLLSLARAPAEADAAGPATAAARARQIVHEVNNPLSIARNYLQVLGMKLGGTHPASKDLKVIEEELVRVSELVMQLTDVPAAGTESDRETVALNTLITDLLRVSRDSLFLPKQIDVELNLDEELPPILSSASSLKQILINLVQNASEAMAEGGRLRIRTRDWHRVDATPFVEIEVTDNGPGIPAEVEPRLFQPMASTKGQGHAGLGLSIVKKLVEDLGGSIGYQSSDRSGTTFRVLLPRVLGERRAPAKQQ